MNKPTNIAIIGSGDVSKALFHRLETKDGDLLKVIALANTSGLLMNQEGLLGQNGLQIPDAAGLKDLSKRTFRDAVVKALAFESSNQSEQLLIQRLEEAGLLHETIIVDTSSGELGPFHQQVISNKGRIVTANKNPLAHGDMDDFTRLTQYPELYGYSATVMAGNNAITKVRQLKESREGVLQIDCLLTGTGGFIYSYLENNGQFKLALSMAEAEGYTETNPLLDLRGHDVARKIVIIARELGYQVSLGDVRIDPMVPGLPPEETLEEFREKIDEYTARFRELFSSGTSGDETYRYVGTLQFDDQGNIDLHVGPKRVKKGSPLHLQGTQNKLVITSPTYGPDAQHQVRGPGAGPEVTALALREDIATLLRYEAIIKRTPAKQ